MFRWIWNNKDWLFSGVGVALILVAARLISQRIKKAKLKDESRDKWSLQQVIEGPPAEPPEIKKEGKSCSLSPLDIMATIDETPLLQRPDVAKNYIGLRVSWDGVLSSAEKTSNGNIRLIIRIIEGYKDAAVTFEINPNQYPGIGLLKYKHPVRVSRLIARISGYFELEDAHIEYDLGFLNK